MKLVLGALMAFVLTATSFAQELSCQQAIGKTLSAKLVQQCRQVSPATRPPCHASNRCELIEGEVERGCSMLAGEAQVPPFCTAKVKTQETVEGVLINGGGMDDAAITVFTDAGRRVRAYCDGRCGDWFETDRRTEESRLKPAFSGRRVLLSVALEANQSRVAGPEAGEKVVFVKQLQLKN